MLFDSVPSEWTHFIDFPITARDSVAQAVATERTQWECYPPPGLEFQCLRLVLPQNVRVVICGQDPYHGPGQAHGLAFSVPAGVPHPPSLRNILKELCSDLEEDWPLERSFDTDGALGAWAREGVLLLNDVLTVRNGAPGSHAQLGWQRFTSAILNALAETGQPLVVLLWGKPAQQHASRFTKPHQLVLNAPHPSPLSAYRGFFGSRPFTQANAWLEKWGEEQVSWMG